MKKWILLTLLLTACANSTEDDGARVDPIDECGLCADERADAFGISRDSYLAYGIVELANTASFTTLDDDVRLDSRAAQGIVDERPFDYIEQIDTVPYVGRSAFAALASYVEDNGFVPSCGDGVVQPLLEACDDGNATDGDGCESSCEVTPAPARRLEDIEELIRGSDIDIPLVDPNAFYMRERTLDDDMYTPEQLALLERADGIIANQRANGKVSFDELAILSKTPFYESLFPEEQTALAEIWEIYQVSSAPIVEINPWLSRHVQPEKTVTRVGPLVLRPRPIADIARSTDDERLLQRIQQLPRLNLDNDPTTVEVADIEGAIADYDQVLTPSELSRLGWLLDFVFETTEELADDGSYVGTYETIPHDWSQSGTFASFDGYEFGWSTWKNLRFMADDERKSTAVEAEVHKEWKLTVNGVPADCPGNVCYRPYQYEGVRFVAIDGDIETRPSNYVVMEHWQNGQRIYNRVLMFFHASHVNGTSTHDYYELFPAQLRLADGTGLRLQADGMQDDWTTYELVRTARPTNNLATAMPQTHEALRRIPAGRYEPFLGIVLEIHESRAAVVYDNGSDTPRVMGLTEGVYRTHSNGRRIELVFGDGYGDRLRVMEDARWTDIRLGDGPNELRRDRTYVDVRR